ncbi:MAG: threonylcarbamoyl-AMP synthase [Candidatus Hecatellales archaeon]|nr:MAG: threonylcarbamoyl-AMP synthase [Candidatus Hecatellales archaeon]
MVEVVRCTFEGLLRSAEIVRNGGVIVYPTDTIYGLGCNPYHREAVNRIFEIKGRRDKPLPVLVSGFHEAYRMAWFSGEALKLAAAFWPGALTMVLPRKPAAPKPVGGPLIGLRCPGDLKAKFLVSLCGGSLVGTSANLSGEKPAENAEEAKEVLGDKVDLILDGGKARLGRASTVVEISQGEIKILREEAISAEEIFKTLRG